MLTPKEKAEELFNKFYYAKDQDGFHSMNKHRAIECAIIAVNEILNINSVDKDYELSNYWNEVLEEINKL